MEAVSRLCQIKKWRSGSKAANNRIQRSRKAERLFVRKWSDSDSHKKALRFTAR